MRKLGIAWLVVGLGLGCSSSDKGGGAVDPAALDFCIDWANGVCRLAYLCTDPSAQDAAFHSRYGASSDNCSEELEKRCQSNQSGGSAFGPSCGPGKKVNSDFAKPCTDSLELETCAAWMIVPAGACDAVCGSGTTGNFAGAGNFGGFGNVGGFGNTGGVGNSPSAGGSGPTTGSLATSLQFCEAQDTVLCDRIFECKPTEAMQLGTLADCKASVAPACESAEFCPGGYDASKADACITAAKTLTCTELMTKPTVCTEACH